MTDHKKSPSGDDRFRKLIPRLREIEEHGPGKKGHIFKVSSDRIEAAREVGKLVQTARDEGVTVERIKQELPGTDRIDRYKLPPEIGQAEAVKRLPRLQQRVSGYLAVAQAVASLTRRDADKLKIGVLIKTSLWSQPSLAQTEEDPRPAHVALELTEMGRAVATRSRLADLFVRARRIPGVWDPAKLVFRQSSMACLFQEAYLDHYEHWTEASMVRRNPRASSFGAKFGWQWGRLVRLMTSVRCSRTEDV
jgi:hypothetical protein